MGVVVEEEEMEEVAMVLGLGVGVIVVKKVIEVEEVVAEEEVIEEEMVVVGGWGRWRGDDGGGDDGGGDGGAGADADGGDGAPAAGGVLSSLRKEAIKVQRQEENIFPFVSLIKSNVFAPLQDLQWGEAREQLPQAGAYVSQHVTHILR